MKIFYKGGKPLKLSKILKSVVILACAGALAASFAACNSDKPKTEKPAKTHDPVTLEMSDKPGTYEPHNFVDGKCTMCDETTIFTQDSIKGDDILVKACDQQGEVNKIQYTTTAYGEDPMTRTAWVYTPYGYDAEATSVKYNVLYMLHGSGLNEGFWFAKGTFTPDSSRYDSTYGTNNLFDNMIKAGTAEKAIVVCPTYYKTGEDGNTLDEGNDVDTTNFYKELKNDLMPYIAENYNTYAALTADMTAEQKTSALVAARDHQGYVGLSLGSMISFTTVWANCIDVFSYIGSFSGGVAVEDTQKLIETKNTTFKDYDINYWYISLGTAENNQYPGDPFGDFRAMVAGIDGLKQGDNIEAGENCQYMKCNRTGHSYQTWITSLYNCLQVFFKAA